LFITCHFICCTGWLIPRYTWFLPSTGYAHLYTYIYGSYTVTFINGLFTHLPTGYLLPTHTVTKHPFSVACACTHLHTPLVCPLPGLCHVWLLLSPGWIVFPTLPTFIYYIYYIVYIYIHFTQLPAVLTTHTFSSFLPHPFMILPSLPWLGSQLVDTRLTYSCHSHTVLQLDRTTLRAFCAPFTHAPFPVVQFLVPRFFPVPAPIPLRSVLVGFSSLLGFLPCLVVTCSTPYNSLCIPHIPCHAFGSVPIHCPHLPLQFFHSHLQFHTLTHTAHTTTYNTRWTLSWHPSCLHSWVTHYTLLGGFGWHPRLFTAPGVQVVCLTVLHTVGSVTLYAHTYTVHCLFSTLQPLPHYRFTCVTFPHTHIYPLCYTHIVLCPVGFIYLLTFPAHASTSSHLDPRSHTLVVYYTGSLFSYHYSCALPSHTFLTHL